MSTSIAIPVAQPGATRSVPLSRLTRVELRKMVDTRAGLWLFVAMGLITAAAVALYLVFASPADLTYAGFLRVTLTPQAFLLPVLGILLITSEWGQRTGLVTFTLEPNRTRVVVAKILAALVVGVLAVAIALTVAAAGNWLGSALQDGDGSWTFGMSGLSYVLILQVSVIVQGLAFGMLLRNSAAAIVLYFVVPIAFTVVFGIVASLRDVAPWIDLGTAQGPLLEFGDALTRQEWAQLAVTSTTWIAVPFVLGFLWLLRSELKSA
jgi:ABC-type transport system involved in multi-copper enzyme maturation permease subunit